jgi:hypothetical protein
MRTCRGGGFGLGDNSRGLTLLGVAGLLTPHPRGERQRPVPSPIRGAWHVHAGAGGCLLDVLGVQLGGSSVQIEGNTLGYPLYEPQNCFAKTAKLFRRCFLCRGVEARERHTHTISPFSGFLVGSGSWFKVCRSFEREHSHEEGRAGV